ncbi:hypothetical protein HanIR_Chr01g0034201 [Helianthus annuus]|nr:hypothetical protein HanIR_Chr01g0034201 [Helianthus annuus]
MLASKFGFFGRSSGKPYRRLPLDSRATTRAELSGVTYSGTKTQLGSEIELTTSRPSPNPSLPISTRI